MPIGPGSVNTRAQTYANAKRFSERRKYIRYGLCLMFSRSMAGIPRKYNFAIDSARHAPRRMGTPPKGTFVYWKGGSKGYGHIAISAGGGYVWSTDFKVRNRVDKVRITSIILGWSMPYIGWSDECNDVRLRSDPRPTPKPKPKPKPRKDRPRPRTRVVYFSKIHPGQKNSDSVWHVQYALNKVKLRGGKRLTISSTYGPGTQRQVKLLQAQKWGDRTPNGHLNTHQVRALFKLAKIKMTFREKP